MTTYAFCSAPKSLGPVCSGAPPNQWYDLVVLGHSLHAVTIAMQAVRCGLSVLLAGEQPITSGSNNLFNVTNFNLEKLESLAINEVALNAKEEKRLNRWAPHAVSLGRYYVPEAAQVRSNAKVLWGLNFLRRLTRHTCTTAPPHQPTDPLYKAQVCGEAFIPRVNALRLTCWALNRFYELGGHAVFGSQVRKCKRGQDWKLNINGFTVCASALVNATGLRVTEVSRNLLGVNSRCELRQFEATTMVTRKLYPGNHGYLLQAPDKQLVYVSPISNQHTVIGPVIGSAQDAEPMITNLYNQNFTAPLAPNFILETRQLTQYAYADPTHNTPKYCPNVMLDLNEDGAALVNVFGMDTSKALITAERALRLLSNHTKQRQTPTSQTHTSFDHLTQEMRNAYPQVEPEVTHRLTAHYGSYAHIALDAIARQQADDQALIPHSLESELALIVQTTGIKDAHAALRLHASVNRYTPTECAAVQKWLDNVHRCKHANIKSA